LEWGIDLGLYGPAFTEWKNEFAPYVEFDSIGEVIEFARDFPGGIWDISESESEQDYRTGEWKAVTLHIPDEIVNVIAHQLVGGHVQ
jgi:hypothetical protein